MLKENKSLKKKLKDRLISHKKDVSNVFEQLNKYRKENQSNRLVSRKLLNRISYVGMDCNNLIKLLDEENDYPVFISNHKGLLDLMASKSTVLDLEISKISKEILVKTLNQFIKKCSKMRTDLKTGSKDYRHIFLDDEKSKLRKWEHEVDCVLRALSSMPNIGWH
jgi:hypothetical protein